MSVFPFGDRISNRGDDVWYNMSTGGSGDPDEDKRSQGAPWSNDLWEAIDSNLAWNNNKAQKSDFWDKVMSLFGSAKDGDDRQIYGYSGNDNAYGFFVQTGITGAGNLGKHMLSDVWIISRFIPYNIVSDNDGVLQAHSSVTGKDPSLGLRWNIGYDGDITAGTSNFALSLKNGLGVVYNEGSLVLGSFSSSLIDGPSKYVIDLKNRNIKMKSEYGLAYIVGASYSNVYDKNTITGFETNSTKQIKVGGLGIFAASLSWDKEGLNDITLGIDAAAGAATVFGINVGGKMGLNYRFK